MAYYKSMYIAPTEIHLSPQQRVYIARQAERMGKPWNELLEPFLPVADAGEITEEGSAYDVAHSLGLIGGITDAPSELATNPDHMEGFGR